MGVSQRLLTAAAGFNSGVPWEPFTQDFTWQSNGDTNGLIYWMGSNGGTTAFEILRIAGGATFDGSSAYGADYGPWRAVDRGASTKPWYTSNTTGHWWKMDLGPYRTFAVTDYTIYRTANAADGAAQMQAWELQGSNDGTNWTTVHTVTAAGLSAEQTYAKFTTNNTTAYRMYRIYTSSGGHQCIGDIEFYGHLEDVWGSWYSGFPDYSPAAPPPTYYMKAPVYSGLNQVIGTWFGEQVWTNPLANHILPLKASQYDAQTYNVGKTANRVFDANGWHTFGGYGGIYEGLNVLWVWDFRNLVSFVPRMLAQMTRYEGSGWPNGKLQGSQDGTNWTDLTSWTNYNVSYSMDGMWIYYGFENDVAYNFLRMISTDSGTARSLQEIELFGVYKSLVPENALGPSALDFHIPSGYSGVTTVPNAGGILHYIGTNYGAEAWQNPATRGLVTVTASDTWGGYPVSLTCDRTSNYWHSATNNPNAWVQFDFGADWRIQPTAFFFSNQGAMSSPKLQGSVDGNTWTDLYTLSALDMAVQSFQVGCLYYTGTTSSFRYLRMIDTGSGSHRQWNEFEFWGYLTDNPPD